MQKHIAPPLLITRGQADIDRQRLLFREFDTLGNSLSGTIRYHVNDITGTPQSDCRGDIGGFSDRAPVNFDDGIPGLKPACFGQGGEQDHAKGCVVLFHIQAANPQGKDSLPVFAVIPEIGGDTQQKFER